jgi:hypothetical protein
MSTQRLHGRAAAVAVAVALALCSVAEARKAEGGDPALGCAAAKNDAAGRYCAQVLKAWSRFEHTGNAGQRDAAIARADRVLSRAWDHAERRAAAAGVDCKGAFLASSTAGAFVDSATGALVDAVNDGLDLDDPGDARCGARIVKAAADACQALLGVESVYQRTRGTHDAAPRRDRAIARVHESFAKAFANAATSCPTTATAADVEGHVDAIVEGIARDVLSSPEAGTGSYVTITPGQTTYQGRTLTPVCMN